LQLPPTQLNWHVAPSSQIAFGQIDPPSVHEKAHVEPAWHVTSKPAQLPDESQLKSQVWPAPQVARPLQTLPPPSQMKSHLAPGWHVTSLQLPAAWQANAQTAPDLQTLPLQLLPPPEQSMAQIEPLSHTTPPHCPLLLQSISHVASWLHCTSLQVLPPPPQSIVQPVPILHSTPLQLGAAQSASSRHWPTPLLQPLHTVVSK
jgi:hypothetical protein